MPEDSFSALKSEVHSVVGEMVVDPFKNAAKLTKEGLIETKDALLASGKVLANNIQEFANSLGIHLPEQGPIPPRARILTTAVCATLTAPFVGLASWVGYEALTKIPTVQGLPAWGPAVLSILFLGNAIPGAVFTKETYEIAMGRKAGPLEPVLKR